MYLLINFLNPCQPPDSRVLNGNESSYYILYLRYDTHSWCDYNDFLVGYLFTLLIYRVFSLTNAIPKTKISSSVYIMQQIQAEIVVAFYIWPSNHSLDSNALVADDVKFLLSIQISKLSWTSEFSLGDYNFVATVMTPAVDVYFLQIFHHFVYYNSNEKGKFIHLTFKYTCNTA